MDEIRSRAPGQLPLLFQEVVEPEKIKGCEKSRSRIYSADVTFWAMLGQVFRGGSLRQAVREVQASFCQCPETGLEVENSTASYSDARQRLPQKSLEDINERVCSKMLPRNEFLNGRRIMVVDATGVQIEDTRANQKSYPQPGNQKEGCGFPVIQLVGLFNLCTGALEHFCDSAMCAHEGGMFDIELAEHLHSGDVLVADRGFCSYLHFSQLLSRGIDVLMRLNSSRDWPKEVSGNQTIVPWKRPCLSHLPEHIIEQEWLELPHNVKVRYIRYRIERKGFRTQPIILATTLMHASIEELVGIYARRWDIELCFDDLKTTMSMDFVRCKSPEMALKMITTHIIAYNLIRYMILVSARDRAHRVSFKGALDTILRFASQMHNATKKRLGCLLTKLHEVIARDIVPERPERFEPRVRKRRPKPFTWMTQSRAILKAEIIKSQLA